MARWKDLPAALDGRERRLIAELRRLKDHSGLSLAALAGKTGYSRSSWERYLNGKQPVPRAAVDELAQVCGVEPTRLLVLHDVAAQARQKPGAPAEATPKAAEPPPRAFVEQPARPTATEPTPATPAPPASTHPAAPVGQAGAPGTEPGAPDPAAAPPPRPRRQVSLRTFIAGIAAALVAAFVAGLVTAGARVGNGNERQATADTGKAGYRRGVAYPCDIHRERGELRAGHSTNREILLDINSTGFDVVEVQCLLREHGFDPGTTEGLYTPGTKDAATRFQAARGLVADGIVGPKTWAELRE
ncbi:helix-turn-helix domain-containing protein [Streptomyces sp. WAC06614]|uniref:helix-turn-helix domain-containing protein n=1 Tax=Streptomyces sp. WAC06614 TaxID=2487416 RepID=UPI000F78718D|nr:helix-turn-helix domain-containing protein [Streptomyces sp. WAC06614]RSS69860.1 peptidoglycan-binding protein [Streptomyces sp. WAC06614]